MMTNRHKVFVSFHDSDFLYKNTFVDMMEGDIIDKSVGDGDINVRNSVDTTRRIIRDNFIADATVTVVLVGACTWQRKYVDWEIGSSLRNTYNNPRCGLMGIILPTHPDYWNDTYKPNLIPPRLSNNCSTKYASMHKWTYNASYVRNWIDYAFNSRDVQPDNDMLQFTDNQSGDCTAGWQA